MTQHPIFLGTVIPSTLCPHRTRQKCQSCHKNEHLLILLFFCCCVVVLCHIRVYFCYYTLTHTDYFTCILILICNILTTTAIILLIMIILLLSFVCLLFELFTSVLRLFTQFFDSLFFSQLLLYILHFQLFDLFYRSILLQLTPLFFILNSCIYRFYSVSCSYFV